MAKKIIIITILALAVAFLPTTIILAFSMMPTIASFSVDKTVNRTRTLCIAFMNFAGAFPYILEFWTQANIQDIEAAFSIIGDTQNIIIIYLLAAGGYAIDIAVTGIMSSLMIQQASSRVKSIEKRQQEMVGQWGEKVTGRHKLDQHGFPMNDQI
jgi:hypothetical protein